jgi:uroporphyrinogen-III synthase
MAGTEPLLGIRVLITRAADDAAQLRGGLRALGATVLEVPTIERLPPHDLAPLDRALWDLERYDWAVFTSRATVQAVLSRVSAIAARLPVNLRVAAVGRATATRLTAAGIAVTLTASDETGAGLAADLETTGVSGMAVLLPVGDLADETLRQALRSAGAHVDSPIAYRTVRPPLSTESRRMLQEEPVDAVLLASPSAARNLVGLLGEARSLLERSRIVCIGPTTADAVRALGLAPAAIAHDRSSDGLIEALMRLYTGEGST